MLAALKVELVGGNDFIVISLGVLGPLLIASAAVIAALVARKTANERQEEQLAHDSERQQEQLRHDTERQERQLEHDREMRQKEHARYALDAAIESMQETQDAMLDLELAAGIVEESRQAAGEAGDEQTDLTKLHDRRKRYLEASGELIVARMRLMVRLGSGHEIPVKLRVLRAGWEAMDDNLALVFDGNRSEAELAEFRQRDAAVRPAFTDFMVACEQWLQFSNDSAASDETPSKS